MQLNGVGVGVLDGSYFIAHFAPEKGQHSSVLAPDQLLSSFEISKTPDEFSCT